MKRTNAEHHHSGVHGKKRGDARIGKGKRSEVNQKMQRAQKPSRGSLHPRGNELRKGHQNGGGGTSQTKITNNIFAAKYFKRCCKKSLGAQRKGGNKKE